MIARQRRMTSQWLSRFPCGILSSNPVHAKEADR
jgi:hypothetical protein